MTTRAGKAEPKITVEKSSALLNMYQVRPPKGYKWKLWSFGQYGLSVILEKLPPDSLKDGEG